MNGQDRAASELTQKCSCKATDFRRRRLLLARTSAAADSRTSAGRGPADCLVVRPQTRERLQVEAQQTVSSCCRRLANVCWSRLRRLSRRAAADSRTSAGRGPADCLVVLPQTRERLLVEADETIVSQVDLAHRLQSLKRTPADLSYSVVADVQHLKARS